MALSVLPRTCQPRISAYRQCRLLRLCFHAVDLACAILSAVRSTPVSTGTGMRPVLTIVATLKRPSARLPTVTQQVRRRWAAPQIPARVAGHQQKKTFDRETGIRNEPATGYQRQKPSSTAQRRDPHPWEEDVPFGQAIIRARTERHQSRQTNPVGRIPVGPSRPRCLIQSI